MDIDCVSVFSFIVRLLLYLKLLSYFLVIKPYIYFIKNRCGGNTPMSRFWLMLFIKGVFKSPTYSEGVTYCVFCFLHCCAQFLLFPLHFIFVFVSSPLPQPIHNSFIIAKYICYIHS